MRRKLTEPQRKVLQNLANKLPAGEGLEGRAAKGGLWRTMEALLRRGYIRHGFITQEGKSAIFTIKSKPNG